MRRTRDNGREERERGREARGGRRAEKPEYTAQFRVERSGVLLPFLMEKCSTSRNNVKSLLSGHYVLVNGSPVSRHDFLLAKDDEVKLSKRPVLQKEGGRGALRGVLRQSRVSGFLLAAHGIDDVFDGFLHLRRKFFVIAEEFPVGGGHGNFLFVLAEKL